MLTFNDHRRDSAGLKYVYPVLSRRSEGLSIGINLNTNNTCNWRCIYCQVPGLKRGKAPAVELEVLKQELCDFLNSILHGNFYSINNIPLEQRNIRDIAISGNGEPTSVKIFDQVIDLIGNIIEELWLSGKVKLVLITNGSFLQRAIVQKGIAHLSELKGEVWFKLDSATNAGMRSINNINSSVSKVRKNLETASRLCPTWIQTCVFGVGDTLTSSDEQNIYLDFLSSILRQENNIRGVMLYGIARPSMQPEANRLVRLPDEILEQYAEKIRETGIQVKVYP